MTSIQPELWVENAREAPTFSVAAFGATVLHLVGDGDDIVAQLGVGDAAFWIAPASSMKRLSPRAIDGATSRTLLRDSVSPLEPLYLGLPSRARARIVT
jgi:uncharacterized glyoxalase superfamily protein PhnB